MITTVEQIAQHVKAERWTKTEIDCLREALKILGLTSNELLNAELSRSPRWLNDVICFTPQYKGDGRRLAEAGVRWRDLFNEQTAPELPKVSNDQGTEAPTTEAAAAELPTKKGGRPKGAKNKTTNPHAWQGNTVRWDSDVVPAVLDVLWRHPGQTTVQILAYLTIHEASSLTKEQLSRIVNNLEGTTLEKRASGQVKGGGILWRWYPLTKRKGWYHKGTLKPYREIAKGAALDHTTIYDRLCAGWDATAARTVPRLK